MKLSKAQARQWVRNHFAEYIENADCGMPLPEGFPGEIWGDECRKIAARLRGRAALGASHDE